MAKTYTLEATLNTGHLIASDYMEPSWSNFLTWNDAASNVGYAGKDGSFWYYATNMMFDQTTLSSLRTKVSNGVTVTGLTLTVYCSKSMTGETLIGYKYNSTASGYGSSGAWTRCHNDGTSGADIDSVAYLIPAQSLSTGLQTFNLYRANPNTGVARPYSGIPLYGLVAGPQTNVNGRWRFDSATLTVTTNEVTVNYKKGANGTGSDVSDAIPSGGSLRGVTYTRTGYTQTGWSTSDGVAKAYNLSATYSGTSDLILYPYWTAVTYTVTYNKGTADGATGSQQTDTKTYGVDLTLKNAIFTRTGYTQQGWSTASAGDSKAYELGSNEGKYTNNAATTLYPYWVANTYAVTYNANGGSGTTASQTKTYGQSLTLRANGFTRTGYAFQHWNTKADGTGTTYAAGASYTANAAVTLYAIWQATASTVSTTNGTLDTAQTITITRSNSSYTHNLSYTYGSLTGSIATDVGTSYSWTPPPSLAAGFPNANSGTCTITCVTKSGTTTIGTTTTTCTLTIPDTADYRPSVSTFTATHHSSNSAVDAASWGGAGNYTKGYSYATLSVANGYTLKGGATLKSIVFSGPGVTAGSGTSTSTNTSVLTAQYPNNSCTWTVTVTDSRNRAASKTVSVTVYDYAPPTISGIVVGRTNQDGTPNNGGGTYISMTPSYGISSVNGKNSISTQTIKFSLHGSSTPIWTQNPCANGTTYNPTNSAYAISLTNAYDVTVTVADAVQAADGNNTTLTVTLPTVQGIWFGKGNDRIGLGGVPEGAGLWCDWDATFKGVVDVTPRRCYATLSSAGWYRVMKLTGSNIYEADGAGGFIVDFNIVRNVDTANNEAHKISLMATWGNIKFINEQSVSNALGITKIRTTNSGSNLYVDVYYGLPTKNTVTVAFNVTCRGGEESKYNSQPFTSVAASPPGETVVTEYTFAANTNVARTAFTPTFSGTANPTVNNTACFYSIKDGVMYAGGRFNLTSFTSGGTTVSFTLPVSLGIADRGAETIGTVFTATKTLQLRSYGADVYITDAGGNYSGNLLNTGYWSFQIVAPIYN